MENYLLSQSNSLLLVISISLIFSFLGIFYSKQFQGLSNYLTANRNIESFSLTLSLVASALGAWILFGPASAATWGGVGAVIGYALGTAAPMLFLYNFGPKIRKEFPKGLALTEFIKKRFGDGILKLSLFLILFYLTIFLIAEVTAIASLLNLISKTPLWATSAITLIICLLYILRGGFKLSVITDKYQFIIVSVIILASFTLILESLDISGFEIIKKNSPNLLDKKYLPNLLPLLIEQGFSLIATKGTADAIKELGYDAQIINKVTEGRPHIVDELLNNTVNLLINTTEGRQSIEDSASIRRTALQNKLFCVTTIFGAFALLEAMSTNSDDWIYNSLQAIN